jgi:lysozyme
MSLGIDVASVDENRIDWAVVRDSGRSFAFVRACYHLTPDRMFSVYWPQMKEARLARGAYLFWDPRLDPDQLATRFLDVVLNEGPLGAGDLPPVVDVEFSPSLERMGLTPAQALEQLERTVGAIEAAVGVAPIIYTSRRVWMEELHNIRAVALSRCPLWVARWSPAEPPCPDVWGTGNWWFHQYAGDASNVPGVSHQADLDRFHDLSEGMEGPLVAAMQAKLLRSATGVFDDATTDAVCAFQRAYGLRVDGVVGPLTWSRLVWEPTVIAQPKASATAARKRPARPRAPRPRRQARSRLAG